MGWMIAGIVAQTMFLFNHISFLGGAETYFWIASWGLALVCLYLHCFRPQVPLSLLILPLVLLLIGGGIWSELAHQKSDSLPADIKTFCKQCHVGTFLLATLSICVGFVAGLTFFVQNRKLKLNSAGSFRFLTKFFSTFPFSTLRLPTLEWSLSICRQSIASAMFLLGICVLSGFLMRPERDEFSYWTDPLVLGCSGMFFFLILVSRLGSVPLHEQEGQMVIRSIFIVFCFLVALLIGSLLLPRSHWNRPRTIDPPKNISQKNAISWELIVQF
ncbi:MAG: hypothetical protein ACRCUY_11445 [Thermoguttaceae bacterium]